VSEQEASLRTPSVPLPWRVQVCRWLFRVLSFVWGTLIAGMIAGTVANFNTTTTDTSLAKLYIIHLAQTYPLPVWSSLSFLAVLALLSWLGSREKQAIPARSLFEQDRSHMLRRLHMRYEQVLTQSLQGVVQLELRLASRPGAVQNAVSLALRLPDQPDHPLPPQTSIVQVYELAQQELLVLGEPGAGKSTLLLELARSLVEQAEQDKQDVTRPLPILLPLASWAEHKRPLEEWLSEEVAHLYDVPRRLSQQWIAAEQVLPLLDGLDEMTEAARPTCIAAINSYHREHLRPLVVCSRTGEYDVATRHEQLTLHTAMVVQPLESKHVDAYLASLGKSLAGLRAALKANTLLQDLATTPLLLQILILTYRGTSVRALPQREKQLREQIWTDYVQSMVEHKGNKKRYPLPVTTGWLGWLASEMRQHNQAIFSLEAFQRDWLPLRQRNLYQWSVRLVFGLALGVILGLVGGLVGGLSLGLIFGLLFGLAPAIETTGPLTWSWKASRSSLVPGLIGGLIFGAVVGLVSRQVFWLIPVLAGVLGWGLIGGLSGKQLTEGSLPNEGIHHAFKNGLFMFAGGLLCGLVLLLIVWPISGQVSGQSTTLRDGLSVMLLYGLVLGLSSGLHVALRHYLLRFWLARSGVFPWRAVPFLEDATARILMRRVGGGYSFAHRLLLDFFADAYTGAIPASPTTQNTQTSSP